MTEAQTKLVTWFRKHAASQEAAGNRSRALRVILGAVDFARRQADLESGEARLLFSLLHDAGVLLIHSGKGGPAARLLAEALELIDAPGVNPSDLEVAELRQRLGMALDLEDDEAGAAEQYALSLEAFAGLRTRPRTPSPTSPTTWE